jgi:hypothetical protein
MSRAQIDEVNDKYRDDHDYISAESSMHLHGTTKKKKLTLADFENDMSTSPFLYMFRFGQAHEGYWTHHHMKLQFEDVIDCLKVMLPGHDIVAIFDQSSGHTAKRSNALNAATMNVNFGGKAANMRSTVLTKKDIGPYQHVLKAGDTQHLQFPNAEDCEGRDGPFTMDIPTRLAHKLDCPEPVTQEKERTLKEIKEELVSKGVLEQSASRLSKTRVFELAEQHGVSKMKLVSNIKTREKYNHELVEDITRSGTRLENRTYRKPELLETANRLQIPTTVSECKMVEGWAGKSKGLLQVLWETGWIDEFQLAKYIKNGKRGRDFNEDNSLKEEVKPFVLRYLMETRSDFASEESDLQHLGRELSSNDCCVNVTFSTKYHCEIAGEGVEYDWGFTKKIMRRVPLENRRSFGGFLTCLRKALTNMTLDRAQRFCRRAQKYMVAYADFHKKAQQTNGESNVVSYCDIELSVEQLFKPLASERKKRKTVESSSIKNPLSKENTNILKAYLDNNCGEKARQKAQKVKDTRAANATAAVNAHNEQEVDVAALQQTQVSHRGSHQDTGYLDAEVQAFFQE